MLRTANIYLSLLTAILASITITCTNTLQAETKLPILKPSFDGKDLNRKQIPIKLVPVAAELSQPTDIQFLPNNPNGMVVLEKTGTAKLVNLEQDKVVSKYQTLLEVRVNSSSEMGLLGLAFHPNFSKNKIIVAHYNPADGQFSRIAKWQLNGNLQAGNETVILELQQPYSNHKGGQVAFGKDKYLYIGFGDGGSGGDPQGNGQNPKTWLGKILRVDIDKASAQKPYSIPPDNPFINDKQFLPEIWALGLRNPWRFSFDNMQRLIVADVGQNSLEEIDIVEKGFNLGWNIKEASECFSPKSFCDDTNLVDPIYEYGRKDGQSVTGGYVYNGKNSQLKGKYIFGDFATGRLWALDLPSKYVINKSRAEIISLGRYDINPSTFGRDADGNLYVADFQSGIIYMLI